MRDEKGRFVKGHSSNPGTQFKKGFTPWNKGINMPDEVKAKVSASKKGKPGTRTGSRMTQEQKDHQSRIRKGKPNGCLGTKRTQESKDKMSAVHIGKPSWNKGLVGVMPVPWNKGMGVPNKTKIRMSIEYRLWREAVFARDNWTCQKYGIRDCKLHPHHILGFAQYPELRFAIDNGITLSKKAHIEFHKRYGIKNNTREQIEQFLKEKSNYELN